jgi:DNA-binding CsgD family transcriptional regulator
MDRRLLDLIGETYAVLDLDAFRFALLKALRAAVPADYASFNDVGPSPGDVFSFVEPPVAPEIHARFARYAHENPLVAAVTRSGNGRVVRLSDVASAEKLHATDLYKHVYSVLGLEYQVAFTMPAPHDYILGIALSRGGRDFTDEECAFLELARPHLIQAYRNAREVTALRRRMGETRGMPSADLRERGLTEREAEIVRLMASGRTNADVAAEVGISPRTVQTHLQNAYRKLGVKTRSEAAKIAWAGYTDRREARDVGRGEALRPADTRR